MMGFRLLAPNFTKCDRKQSNFPQCLRKAVGDAVRLLKDQIPEIPIYLDPLELPVIHGEPRGKIITFQQHYKIFKIWGFSNANCSKVEMNFVTKNLTVECTIPELVAGTEYYYVGQIYGLPLNETGPAMLTHKDVKTHLSFLLEEYMKNGLKYFRVVKDKFLMELSSFDIRLGNLFKGDHDRSKLVNQKLNENALETFNELKHNYVPVIGEQFAIFFDNLLRYIPAFEIFGNE